MAIKKIVVIGPESTGKSTLCEALAIKLNTVWVPEYARQYLENLERPYNEADLLLIAKGQVASEDALLNSANGYLVCDTDLNVIKVWSEHKYGRCHPYILQQVAERKYDFYLLADIDIPWQYDPLREHEDRAMRQHFYSIYKGIVAQSGIPWAAISGAQYEERLQKAIDAIGLI